MGTALLAGSALALRLARTGDVCHSSSVRLHFPVQHRLRSLLLAAEPRTTIVTDSPTYIRAAAASRVFRFVDDVEMRLSTTAHLIRFRSGARLGYGDLGVNRARMQRIVARLRM